MKFILTPLKIITLNDKSEERVRIDLFERLNTGGLQLSAQEIRNCVYQGKFKMFLKEMAEYEDFKKLIKLQAGQKDNATDQEMILRFFAYYEKYLEFDHSVEDFLNNYMKESSKMFNYMKNESIFKETFSRIYSDLGGQIIRRSVTPLNLFEAITVGGALAIDKKKSLKITGTRQLLEDPELKKMTAGATNTLPMVKGRIEYCMKKYLGK